MPFRKRNNIKTCGFYPPAIVLVDCDENGPTFGLVKVNGSVPKPSDFDLDVLLRSGIPVSQVSTKILKPGISDIVAFTNSIHLTADSQPTAELQPTAEPQPTAESQPSVSNS